MKKIFLTTLLTLSVFLILGQTTFPSYFCSQNAYMPDCCGVSKIYGKVEANWSLVKSSNVKLIRYGGNTVESNIPTLTQYLKIVDSVRAKGMEPILQVSYNNGSKDSAWARKVVKYINKTKARKVKYWIIGNEPDLNYTNISAIKISTYMKQYALAMKNEDPTILIVGPEFSRIKMEDPYDAVQKMVDTLTSTTNPYSLMDTISGFGGAHGKAYLDYFSYHLYSYVWNSGVKSRSWLINRLTSTDSSRMGSLRRRLDQVNVTLGRTSQPIKPVITEANIAIHPNGSTPPGGDSFQRMGCSGFFAGQHWAEMMALGMSKGLDWINFWSAIEGNGQGYLTSATTPAKKSTYYHIQQMAYWFRDTIFLGTDDSASLGESKAIKCFGSKSAGHIAVMVLNQDTSSKPAKYYSINLNNTYTGSEVNRIKLRMHLNKTYHDTIKSASSTILIFDCNGDIAYKSRYELTDSLNPFKSVWAASSPASVLSVGVGPDANCCPGGVYTIYATGNLPSGTTYQWYKNGVAISGATSSSYATGTAGTYKCVATLNGCTESDDMVLTVAGIPCGNPMRLTGVKENKNEPVFTAIESLIPNPTDNQLKVQYSIPKNTINAEIHILNYSGQIVDKYQLNAEQSEMEISCVHLAPGLYFTSLVVEGKTVNTKKLIIAK